MNVLILFLAILTAFLLGAQVSAFVPLPLLWGIWAIIILIVLVLVMININGRNSKE